MNCSQQTNGTTNMTTLLQKNCIKTLSVNNGVVVVGTAAPNAASSATTSNIQPMIANASHVQPIQAFQYQQLQTVQAQPQYIIYNPTDGTMFRPVTTATVPNIPTTFISNNAIYQQQPQPIITQSNILPKIGTIASHATTATPRVLNIVGPRKVIKSVNVAQLSKMPKLTAVTTAPRLVTAPAPKATTKAIATKLMPIINSSNQQINLGNLHPISTGASLPPTSAVLAVSTNGAIVKRIDNINTPITSASLTNFSDRTRTLVTPVNSGNRTVVYSNRGQLTGKPMIVANNTIPAVQRNVAKTTTVTWTVPTPTSIPTPLPALTPTPTPVPTAMPSSRASPMPSSRASPMPTSRASPMPTSRASPMPTSRASPLPSSRASPMPTATPAPLLATPYTTQAPKAKPIDTQPAVKPAANSSKPVISPVPQAPPVLSKPTNESYTNNNAHPTNTNVQQPIAMETSDCATNAAEEENEPEPEIDIVINNVVCSFSVRCHLNLREIALSGKNVEFRRENGMVTMKLRKPYTTASIWSSGRITCTGATSEDQAKVGARRYARVLQSLGFPVRFNNFRVVNVLGTCSMPWAIKIVNFSEKFKREASYEPELHPGVTYKLRSPKATLKIFSTGSITVTAASVNDVQSAIEHIFPLVYEFRKKRAPAEIVQPVENFDQDNEEDMGDIMGLGGGDRGAAPKKMAKKKAVKRKYPFGLAENDPDEDLMAISDVESDADGDNDDF